MDELKPKVVRIRRQGGVIVQDCDVYIGRRQTQGGWNLKESVWANKNGIDDAKGITREKCIAMYENDLREKMRAEPEVWIPRILELEGKTLGCYCKEKGREVACHGDVIVKWFEKLTAITELEPDDPRIDEFVASL